MVQKSSFVVTNNLLKRVFMSRRHIFLLSVVTVFSINCYADDTNTITPSNVFNMAPSNIPTNKTLKKTNLV